MLTDGRLSERLPYLKFFPADWQSEETLRGRTLAARGLWMDMICIMHKSSRRGFLLNKAGAPIDPSQLAIMVGAGAKEVTRLLQELERAETFSRDKDGVIYCRRMVEKANLSAIRSECGAMGGRPPKSKKANQKQNESKPKGPPEYASDSASASGLSQKQEDATPRDSAPTPRPGSIDGDSEHARLAAEADVAFGGDGDIPPPETPLLAAVRRYCGVMKIPHVGTNYNIFEDCTAWSRPESYGAEAVYAGLEWGTIEKKAWRGVASRIRNYSEKSGWVPIERSKNAAGNAGDGSDRAKERRAKQSGREYVEDDAPIPTKRFGAGNG